MNKLSNEILLLPNETKAYYIACAKNVGCQRELIGGYTSIKVHLESIVNTIFTMATPNTSSKRKVGIIFLIHPYSNCAFYTYIYI